MEAECNGKVFISHSHEDNERCRPLLEALRQWGIDYWFDTEQLNAGHDLARRIQDALSGRDIFIRICTGAMQRRPFWVDKETHAFYGLQAEAVNAGYPDKRRLINIILDAGYRQLPFDRDTVFIEAWRMPQDAWLDALRRALALQDLAPTPALKAPTLPTALTINKRPRRPVETPRVGCPSMCLSTRPLIWQAI